MSQIESIYSPQVEKQLQQIYSELEKHQKKVLEISKMSVDFYGGKTASNPNDLKKLTSQLDVLNKKIEEQEKVIKRLTETKTRLNAKTSEEIVNQRALAQASDRQAKATSNVVGAYARLNAQYQIAEKRLLDLKSTQNASNREIKIAQREFDVLRKRVLDADNAVGRWNKSSFRSIGLARDLMGAFGVVGGAYLFANITTDAIKLIKELQSLNLALQQVSETQYQYALNVDFLTDISERYGVKINDLTKQFTQFYVSAKDKISATEIQDIFDSITKAGSTMGLSVQQQERAYLALNQMMSKGTIQAEELRGQLGEALPGALTIMAKAVGVSERQLGKMMKAGDLLASEVLPKFAKELEKAYGIENIERVKTLNAETNRLSNTWTNFVRSIDSGDGVISKALISIIGLFTKLLNTLKNINNISWTETQANIKRETNLREEAYKQEIESLQKIGNVKKEVRRQQLEASIESNKLEIESYKSLINLYTSNIAQNKNKKIIEENKELLRIARNNIKIYEKGLITDQARIKAVDDYIYKQIKATEADAKKIKKVKELKEEEENFVLGSVGWYQKRITKLTEEAEVIKKNSKVQLSQNEAYQTQLKVIADLQKGLDRLLETKKEEIKLGDYLNAEIYSPAFFDAQISNLEGRLKLINRENEAYAKLNEQLQLWKDMRDAMYGTGDAQEQATEKLEDFANYYAGFVDEFKNNSGFGKMFDLLATDLDRFKGDSIATALAISDAFQEAFNTISNASQQNFDFERELNEERYALALKFANGNAEAEEELAREKERREKEIARREAQARKRIALFNIAIDGAQAITATLAKGGPSAIPLSFVIGGLILAQAALVASQEIPEFWKGTDNAPEGWAKTDERGAEIHTDSKGNIKDFGSSKGTRVKYLEKGDKIINANKTKELLSLANFNKEYNDLLFRNQILPPVVMNNSNNVDLTPVVNELKAIRDKETLLSTYDENGIKFWKQSENAKIELKNSRIHLKSRNVRG